MHFPTDRLCLEKIWATVGKFDSREVTLGWIRNTLELGLLALTANLLPEIRRNPLLEVVGGPFDWPFEDGGDLTSLDRIGEPYASVQV